jgi:hypothetical protein
MSAEIPTTVTPALLAASLAFPIVLAVLGYFINSALQRNADDRKFKAELHRDQLKTEHDKRVQRAIIRAELKSLVNIYISEIKYAQDNDFTYVPSGFFNAFHERTPDIGLLPSAEVESVMDAYYTYREHIGYIARNGIEETETVKPRDTIAYALSEQKRTWLINDLNAIVHSATKAIETMGSSA